MSVSVYENDKKFIQNNFIKKIENKKISEKIKFLKSFISEFSYLEFLGSHFWDRVLKTRSIVNRLYNSIEIVEL